MKSRRMSVRTPRTPPKQLIKLVILGDAGVGKSSLTLRLVSGEWVDSYEPTIEDAFKKLVNIDGDAVVLDLLDTAGQEEFSAVRDEYMRDGQGFIMCYSVTSQASFEAMHSLCEQLLRARDVDDMRNAKFAVIVVGNKSDMDDKYRQVSTEEGKRYARKHGYMFVETSAKMDVNVGDAFFMVARGVRQAIGTDLEQIDAMYTHKSVKAKNPCSIL